MAPVSSTLRDHDHTGRALSSPTPRDKQRLAGGASQVYAGWLFVEANNKREFAWRFCVLDGDRFQVYRNEVQLRDLHSPATTSALVRQHFLVHVERMHRLNRGLLLVDRDGYGLWVHGTHDASYFEQWFALVQDAVLSQPVRLTISRYGFVHQSSGWASDAGGVAYTGWLRVRRVYCRGWVLSPARRLYCVLSGRHFSAFKLNYEGRWADLYGKIQRLALARNTKWLELTMDSGATIHVAAKAPHVTSVWELRIEAALRREPCAASTREALVGATKPPQAPRRILTF